MGEISEVTGRFKI